MKPYDETLRRWASPSVTQLRYGNTPELRKLTYEAQQAAMAADAYQRTAKANVEFAGRALKDPTLGDAQRVIRTAKYIRAGLQQADGAYNRALDGIAERAKALSEQLEAAAAPPADAGRGLQSAMLLQLVREMDPAKALGEIRAEPALLRAVASAPRVLSGLSAEAYNNLRREHWQQTAPDALAALDDLMAAGEALEQARKSAHGEASDLCDMEQAEALESRQVAA